MLIIFTNLYGYSILMKSSWQRSTSDRPLAKFAAIGSRLMLTGAHYSF